MTPADFLDRLGAIVREQDALAQERLRRGKAGDDSPDMQAKIAAISAAWLALKAEMRAQPLETWTPTPEQWRQFNSMVARADQTEATLMEHLGVK